MCPGEYASGLLIGMKHISKKQSTINRKLAR
nr:MAG TPA: hypothetical protein [Caudoviricetes sp.]